MNHDVELPEDAASLPAPEIYEKEYEYWPWGTLLRYAAQWVAAHAPNNAVVLDYMCGTGYLLNEIAADRPDLCFYGCSITPAFIAYANRRYPHLHIIREDALCYRPPQRPDIVLCTAGLHHLPLDLQPTFIRKVASELPTGRYFLLGEELIREHSDKTSRALAALEMSNALIACSLQLGAPRPVIEAAFQMLHNDVFLDGEYKRARSQVLAMLEPYFEIEHLEQTWPKDSDAYGDFLFICKRR